MPSNIPRLEVRSGTGELLLTITLGEEPSGKVQPRSPSRQPDKPVQGSAIRDTKPGQSGRPATQGNQPPVDGEPMTESQKRYLFRILAARGIEGNQAYDHLKNALHVRNLKDATKKETSVLIDRLVNENGRGVSGDD